MPTDSDRAKVRALLQLEGALALVLGAYLYAGLDLSWWLFLGLFLIPDLFIVAYLVNTKLGAIAYNVVHTYTGPLVLALYAVWSGSLSGVTGGFLYVWFAHIGLDRMILAGLKYPTAFKHTHLSPPSAFEARAA